MDYLTPPDFGEESRKYNRVVLLGNGFDLSLGLKTKYCDFILHIFKSTLKEIFDRAEIKTQFLTKAVKASERIQLISQTFDAIENCATIQELRELENGNYMQLLNYNNDFFKKIVQEHSITNWIDIESYYYYLLRDSYHNSKTTLNIGVNENKIAEVVELNKSMDYLTDELANYLLYATDSISEKEVAIRKLSLLEDIIKPMKLSDYKRVWMSSELRHPEEILILNFNYTNTIEKAIDSNQIGEDVIFRVNQIHGSIYNPKNPPIFGYGDDTSDEYVQLERDGRNELLRKIKSFQYPNTENYHNFLGFIDSKPFEVFIIGHSCGLSDKTMLRTLFEHEHCRAIKNFHYLGNEEDFYKRMTISRIFTDKALMRRLVLPFDEYARV